ncbi:MAG TPA: HAMP domain-containing histidine kinase [Bacteroidetes bacterium]|nr:HAMP domain-containing histidine kinase [Bacteroidota bacterium]
MVNIYHKKTRWKLFLLLGAVVIGLSSLFYTQKLVEELSAEERKKVELWAEATRKLIEMDVDDTEFDLLLRVIETNNTVPLILTNEAGDTLSTRNLDPKRLKNRAYLDRQLRIMRETHDPIVIKLDENENLYLHYKDSILLTKLFYFPYIQLGVIILFILVSYFAFSASRKAEQNQVWVGLSRETAHQLGTPISSLMAWLELIKMNRSNEDTLKELEKDVKRLEKIADRFSKIGSRPVLTPVPIHQAVQQSVAYIRTRSSAQVNISTENRLSGTCLVDLNTELFEWVIENLCKNAIDALGGSGLIRIVLSDNPGKVFVDIRDEGKGIPKKLHKTVFKPGYTSKPRGWGLGLSLARRIVENYHSGKIFVLQSEPGKGTTFRIVLNKEKNR